MNDVQFLHRQREPAVDRTVEAPPEIFPDSRPGRRRRGWGGRLLGLGVLLGLACGLSLGAWRHISLEREAVATAVQRQESVPGVRAAAVRASDGIVRASYDARSDAMVGAALVDGARGPHRMSGSLYLTLRTLVRAVVDSERVNAVSIRLQA